MSGYRAHFQPQAWQNNYAIDVDAEGPQEWEPAHIPPDLRRLVDEGGGLDVLDNDDALKEDDNAPEWVRKWKGPFTIMVRKEVDP